VRGVKFLDHLHARAAVVGDLVDVCPIHQTHRNVSVP
jgi:hypothetical protein